MYYILGAGGLDAQKVLEGLRGSAETPAGARRTERKLRRALGGRNFGGALARFRRQYVSGVFRRRSYQTPRVQSDRTSDRMMPKI